MISLRAARKCSFSISDGQVPTKQDTYRAFPKIPWQRQGSFRRSPSSQIKFLPLVIASSIRSVMLGKNGRKDSREMTNPGAPWQICIRCFPPLPSPSFVGQLPSLCCRFNKRSSLLLANDRFAKFGSVRISCVRIPISPWATPIYRFSCQVQSGPAAMMRSMILFLISAKQEVRSGY